MPQDWETPKWVLPVTIPMLDDTLKVVDMIDSESSSIDLIESDYSVTENLVMIPAPPEEGSISIDESYFQVPKIGDIAGDINIDIPQIDTNEISPDIASINIPISDVIPSEFDGYDCIPANAFGDSELIENLSPIENQEIYSPDNFNDICDDLPLDECEFSVNDIVIDNGTFDLTVANGFPFVIDNFQLEFTDQNGDLWINSQVENVLSDSFEMDQDDLGVLPTSISAIPAMSVSDQSLDSSWPSCIVYIPLSEAENDISFTPEQCIQFEVLGLVDENCNSDIDNEDECLILNEQLLDHNIVWYENECQLNTEEPGWLITGDEEITIDFSFTVNTGSVDADINMVYREDGTSDVAVQENIELISAHLIDTDDINTNKLYINYENNMFGDFSFTVEFDDFYNESENLLIIGSDDLDSGGMYDFSNHYIGNPSPDYIDVLNNIDYSIIGSLDDSNVIIEMNTDYGFEVESARITAFEFDQLKVNLQEFESPPIEMGDMPAGLSGMELPTLAFDLIFYNEINCPLTLNLDIIGVNEFETTTIHVEPDLSYYDYYEEIDLNTDGITKEQCEEYYGRYDEESGACTYVDESIIRILENNLDVIEIKSIGDIITYTITSYEYGLNADGEEITIYDVFSADNIQVEGYASLSGICELESGVSVSADLELIIDPLTIVLTDDITFISETPSEIQPVASSENTIVQSAVLKLDIENHIPVDGRFDFLISNESQFPPCLDSLVSDLTLEEQVANLRISQTCVDYINQYYPSLSSISVECEDIDDDCSEDYNFYYVDFELNNGESVFFGKLADMVLLLPSDIDDGGYVQTASSYSDSLNLVGDKLDWLSKDNLLYVTPQVILSKSDNDDSNGYRTLRSTDYISFQSFLRLEIDMGEVIE